MKKAMTVGLGCVLLLTMGVGAWLSSGGMGNVGEPHTNGLVGSAVLDAAPEAPGSERVLVAEIPAPTFPGIQSGTLVYANGLPAAGVPYWIWGEVRPFWTRVPEEPRRMSRLQLLEDPAGSTGGEGEWRLPSEPAEAITFAPFEGILVSYELAGFEAEPAFELPPFTEINLSLKGARDDDRD